jgi:hypothetical protein
VKLLALLLLLVSPAMAEPEVVEEVRWPSYCIRSVVINEDGTFLLDMPGWPNGMDDKPFLVTTLRYLNENTTNCTPDDPRMNLDD